MLARWKQHGDVMVTLMVKESSSGSVPTSDISVSKINLVSITVLRVTGFFTFLLFFSFENTFPFQFQLSFFQIILISVSISVFISVSGFIILINKSITLILEL